MNTENEIDTTPSSDVKTAFAKLLFSTVAGFAATEVAKRAFDYGLNRLANRSTETDSED